MGTNRINEMMKRIVQGTQLEHQQQKKLTNHSARKTVVNKLKKNNVERSSIVKVTGHRNLQSLDDYDEGDEPEATSRLHD
jgi:replication initiation and membrane attachment protein DnaB